jgi:5-methylcytosine-specific restriction endonuclease McrA
VSDRRSSRAWRRVRAAVIARDGGVCWLCGGLGADSVDHLVQLSRGGSDAPANLRAAHLQCNMHRHRQSAARPPHLGLGRPSRVW